MRALLACGSTVLVYDVLALPHQKAMKTKPEAEPKQERRERTRPLRVFVSPSEREAIAQHAKLANMTLSAYLRATGLNSNIRSTLDYDAARLMLTVAGDLGKFTGIVKLWLSQRRGEGVSVGDLNNALKDALATQSAIMKLVKAAEL